jgi:hypothetical protein
VDDATWSLTVSQHHLPIEHFLTQLDTEDQDRSSAKRDARPEWLTHFIDSIADLFDPLIGFARVGFDCNFVEGAWVVGLYLGAYEIVGGRHDGEARHINFEFDLQQLMAHFSKVTELVWSAFPSPRDTRSSWARSYVTIAGQVADQSVRLQVFSVPPVHAEIGMRRYPDGRFEPA